MFSKEKIEKWHDTNMKINYATNVFKFILAVTLIGMVVLLLLVIAVFGDLESKNTVAKTQPVLIRSSL